MTDRLPTLEQAVDVHAHFLPDGYRTALAAAGIDHLDGMPGGAPDWSVGSALELMDEVGIARSVLSISSPGVVLDGLPGGVRLSRQVNEAAAEVQAAHPRRFTFLASLPLPDIGAALEELDRSMSTLGAAGVVLLTNYRGHYLGDRLFEPLLVELNRRRAIVVLHPTSPPQIAGTSLTYPPPLMDFTFETTRTVVDLILTSTVDRLPNIRFVVPHGGAALPGLVDRLERVALALARTTDAEPVDIRGGLGQLWYDVAGGTPAGLLPGLLTIAPPNQLVYGTDFPFTPAERVRQLARMYQTTELLTPDGLDCLLRANPARLLAIR